MLSSTHFRSSSCSSNKLVRTRGRSGDPGGGQVTLRLAWAASLTTLAARAAPLLSFFIPLIFIPSADTNMSVWEEPKVSAPLPRREFPTKGLAHHRLLLLFLAVLVQQRAEGVPAGDRRGSAAAARAPPPTARAPPPLRRCPTSGC